MSRGSATSAGAAVVGSTVATGCSRDLRVSSVRTPVIESAVPEYLFELYVAGNGIRSRTAVETFTTMCDERLTGRYGLVVVDVLVDPERAEHAKILATPTLLRRKPAPDVRIIGDLTLTRSVLDKLGVPAEGSLPGKRVRRDA